MKDVIIKKWEPYFEFHQPNSVQRYVVKSWAKKWLYQWMSDWATEWRTNKLIGELLFLKISTKKVPDWNFLFSLSSSSISAIYIVKVLYKALNSNTNGSRQLSYQQKQLKLFPIIIYDIYFEVHIMIISELILRLIDGGRI